MCRKELNLQREDGVPGRGRCVQACPAVKSWRVEEGSGLPSTSQCCCCTAPVQQEDAEGDPQPPAAAWDPRDLIGAGKASESGGHE